MAVALEQFVKQLEDSGVIAPGKLENFVPPKAQPKDAQELARQLILSKQLTKFQVQEIYQGRSKSLILGNYTILDKIGAGGMGQVFKAEHRRMHRLVAIKMLPKNAVKSPTAVARFQREVEAAAKLRHSNIVATDDADEAGGVHFLVMEYIEGSDLSALVKKDGPLSVRKAVHYILQAARGLEFAHAEHVVHRDIKPANLLVDKKGTVKILDMGLARIETDVDAATQAELTGTGAVMGTVDYMAPEQGLSTKSADARADIYSLGCTLHYLLTGKPAYGGETITAKLLAHHQQPIPNLRNLNEDVPAELQAIFDKMVAKKVEDRYQSMSEVVAALESLEASASGVQTSMSMAPSIETNSDAGVLTFLNEIPAATTHKPKPVKKSVPAVAGKRNKKLILGAIGAGLMALAIVAAVIFKMQTKDRTLVVEVNQPDATVEVLDADGKIEISQPGGKGAVSISVDPGKHRLKVEKDGFRFFAKNFEMESGGERTIKATLEPNLKNTGPGISTLGRWMTEVSALPAEKQVQAVAKKLQDLNPGFDGKETHKIEAGMVTELHVVADNLLDISPIRALTGLKVLECRGNGDGKSQFRDLAPLHGMHLTGLNCGFTQATDLSPLHGMGLTALDWNSTPVSDLSPLKGMPLTELRCQGSSVSDLSPLQGMRLTSLWCWTTPVSDLSPLKGMPLIELNCNATSVSDLSPLKGMPLTTLCCRSSPISDLSPLQGMNLHWMIFTAKTITKGIDVVRQMKSMEAIAVDENNRFPPDQFWKKYDAGEFGKPISTLQDPAFQQWMNDVATMPAEKQVAAVAQKLRQINPGFDGKETHKIEGGVVTEIQFITDNVTDISPVRALAGLTSLKCNGNFDHKGRLFDLSPLKGMRLTILECSDTRVSDLSPLKGMLLTKLGFMGAPVSDLSPLREMPLTLMHFQGAAVSDLSPLDAMKLAEIWFTPKKITKGLDVIRQMKSIGNIGVGWGLGENSPPDVFWKKYDAGDFGK